MHRYLLDISVGFYYLIILNVFTNKMFTVGQGEEGSSELSIVDII